MIKEGVAGTRKLTDEEKRRLRHIDEEFFMKEIEFRTGTRPRIEECEVIEAIDGMHVLSYARRIICPKDAAGEARRLLNARGFDNLPVVSSEELPSALAEDPTDE